MKKVLIRLVLSVILISFFTSTLFVDNNNSSKAQAYDRNNLCSDRAFINTGTLSNAGIQSLLVSKGSFLKDYSQNGRKASQIIGDAARAEGINPIAILATLQKEEGIIYGIHAASYNQVRMDWAMGYGYTDSVIYQKYKGFTTQVEYGTWQLRRNYDYWATNGSEWNVGKTMSIDGTAVTFRTRCTSSLYRYTPHLGGNSNFSTYWNLWGGEGTYSAALTAQGPYSGAGSYSGKTLPNQPFTIWANYKNTGNMTWTNAGVTPAHLGTASPNDRGSVFMNGQNRRGTLVQASVAPGQIGTFRLSLVAPSAPGVYYEAFQPVIEYVAWIGAPSVWRFTVDASGIVNGYRAVYSSQGPKTGPGSYSGSLARGQKTTLYVVLKNTGTQTWYSSNFIPVRLGTQNPQDHTSVFSGTNRARLVQASVSPGQYGTFVIPITAPNSPGRYVEYWRPVTENVTWFGPTIAWTLTVK